MTITTKLSINDTGFFLMGNKVVQGLVISITTRITLTIDKKLFNDINYNMGSYVTSINEQNIFKTKAELLKSL